ncbi:MmgE/PrpD family protein [Dysosmobacter sp.]|mgnify:FL=1|jgi:hypothetical protein|uniref:MmgE/PrpD family protein n=1 Tax=Dysosmobacter sp. TaxID=2591382 RepID=UPI003AB14DF6
MGTAEEAICRFVSALQWQDIPEAVKGCARRCFTDTMACIISGGKSVQFRAAEAVIDQNHASRHYLAGQGLEQVNLYDSVLLNACAAHSEEYNDLFFGRPGHPSAVLVPVVLGLGFSRNASASSVMESYVAGLEVMALVNQALLPNAHKMGFHTTSVAGVVGAAAAAGKLLHLPQDGLERALSIACTFACGLRANFGTLANALHVGNAAAAGLRAAQFAAAGFYTGKDLLSGSFLTCYGGSREQLEILAGSLGQTWAFLEPGLLIKKYPCCFSNYQAIEAALNITEMPGFSYDRIEQVTCLTSENHFMSLPVFWPDTPYRARFCIPYCVAAALLQGNIDEASFSEKMLHNTALLRCRDRIRYDVDPRQRGEEGFGYSRIIVVQDSGQRFEAVSWPRKEERAQCWDEKFLKNKFLNCCAWTFSKTQAQRVYDVCMHIDELREISELLCVLCRNEMPESR